MNMERSCIRSGYLTLKEAINSKDWHDERELNMHLMSLLLQHQLPMKEFLDYLEMTQGDVFDCIAMNFE